MSASEASKLRAEVYYLACLLDDILHLQDGTDCRVGDRSGETIRDAHKAVRKHLYPPTKRESCIHDVRSDKCEHCR
jgi:hypothetical protein